MFGSSTLGLGLAAGASGMHIDAAHGPMLDAFDWPLQLLYLKVLRRPLEPKLDATVDVVDELLELPSIGKRLLRCVEGQIAPQRVRNAPANDLAREDVRDEGDVREAPPGRHVRQVRKPRAGSDRPP